MAEKLEACPFCGGVGDIESQPSYSQAANTYERYRGWCDSCGYGLDWHSHETDAIAAWNTRATPDRSDDALAEENRRLRLIVEMIANADSEDCIGSLDVDIPHNGYPRQWLRDAARAALKGDGL